MHVLITEEQINERIGELAGEVNEQFAGQDDLVVVCILKGALHFASDLLRRLDFSPRVEFVRVQSYTNGGGEHSASPMEAKLIEVGSVDVAGRPVLVLDDILDQGGTARVLQEFLSGQKPKSIHWALLTVKKGAIERAELDPDFVGFHIPDAWVVGYGLDQGEAYRNLPEIYEL